MTNVQQTKVYDPETGMKLESYEELLGVPCYIIDPFIPEYNPYDPELVSEHQEDQGSIFELEELMARQIIQDQDAIREARHGYDEAKRWSRNQPAYAGGFE